MGTRARARRPWQLWPRRRGYVPGSVASKMAGKGAGEVDGGAVLLIGYSIWGEEGPRVELDVRGRLPGGGAVAAGGGRV